MPSRELHAELPALIELFYSSPADLGRFQEVAVADTPQPFRRLLAHRHHMTVTVEDFHRCHVDVRVLAKTAHAHHYERKILLTRQTDHQVVQFGIVRINFDFLPAIARQEIESQSAPLGRILIRHNVLREIELKSLWRVEPGPELRQWFAIQPGLNTYGRTAIIHCNGEPAIELLEILAPENQFPPQTASEASTTSH